MNISGVKIGVWKVENIKERIIDKIQTLLLVKAKTKFINGKEHFWYYEASILTGCNNKNFFAMLNNGKVVLDLRMHLKKSGAARNHGTGFRIFERHLEGLYLNKEKII
jgi:hypothetical protein